MRSSIVNIPTARKDVNDVLKGALNGDTETLSASGVLSLQCTLSIVNTASGSAVNLSLANGVEGQEKIILVEAKGAGSIVITPASCRGGTTITITAANIFTALKFLNGKWSVMSGQAAA